MGRPRKNVSPLPPGFEEEQAFDYEQMGENVLGELSRRLRTPALAEGLPGTLLMKLAENYLKYLERKQLNDEGKPENHPVTALEIIDQPGLSVEKKFEIMNDYIGQLEDEWKQASERMVEIVGELQAKENGDSETLSEVPLLVPQESQ